MLFLVGRKTRDTNLFVKVGGNVLHSRESHRIHRTERSRGGRRWGQ